MGYGRDVWTCGLCRYPPATLNKINCWSVTRDTRHPNPLFALQWRVLVCFYICKYIIDCPRVPVSFSQPRTTQDRAQYHRERVSWLRTDADFPRGKRVTDEEKRANDTTVKELAPCDVNYYTLRRRQIKKT